jgi:DNA-binding transcriptional LysR family regulator
LPQVEQPQRALDRGETDLLIVPKAYSSPDHPTEHLFDEEFCCVVWSGSRFAQSGLSLDDYGAAGHVVMQPPTGSSFETLFMQRAGIARRVEVSTFSFTAVPFLVVGTERIATLHVRLARHAARSLPLKVLPLPVPMPKMEESMQWHKYRTQDLGLVWLREQLHEAVRRMDARETTNTKARRPPK